MSLGAAFAVQVTIASPPVQFPAGFLAATTLDVGRSPRVLLYADFTGDKVPDFVTHRLGQASVVVLPGAGHGEFLAAKVSSLATDVLSIAAGDFNSDGFLDLVTTSREQNAVGIAVNDGTGVFRQIQTLNGVQGPYGIAIADVNGDKANDIVVANFYGASIAVFLSAGPLRFYPAVTYAVGSNPFDVTVGDLNGDHFLDVAVANSGANSISILRGNSDGTFAASIPYSVGLNPRHVSIGDLDKDNDVDLVVSNNGASTLAILRNNGSGSFEQGATIAARAGVNYTIIRDLNRDTLPDLVVANGNDNSISVLLAKGDGTYQTDQPYVVGNNPTWLVADDINSDGLIDLAAPNFGSGTVSVLLGKAPPLPTAMPSPSPTRTPMPTATPEPRGESPVVRRFEINGGALATGSTNVHLVLEASDPDTETALLQMRLSNNGEQWEPWQTLRQNTAWQLNPGNGGKKVFAQVRDNRDNRSALATDTILLDDRVGDTYSVTINNGSRFTNNTKVELTITAKPGTEAMQVSSDGSFTNAVWEPYTPLKPWQVERYKNKIITRIVYVRFRTATDMTLAITDDILLDINAPKGKVIAPKVTLGSSVQEYALTIEASDEESGLADMRLSDHPSIDDTLWEEFSSTRLWRDGGSGRVYVQLRDAAGNVSDLLLAQVGAQGTYVPIAQR